MLIAYNSFVVKCQICSKKVKDRKGLSYHISMGHKIEFWCYVVEHELNGVRPICACGCGEFVKFFGGKFMTYLDHHQPGYARTEETKKKLSLIFTGRKQSKETTEKRRSSLKKFHQAHPEAIKALADFLRGKPKSDEHKRKISKTRKQRIDSGEIVINSDKISQSMAQKHVDGGFRWSKGEYTSLKMNEVFGYRSSWELEFMKILDNDDCVSAWNSEPMWIMYELNGKKKRYVPDFVVSLVDGRRFMIEVKPRELSQRPMNLAKERAALEECTKRGWSYAQWDVRHPLPWK